MSKQYDSIVTSTKSLTSNDIPFGWKINVIRNKIKTTAINKDSGTNTNVNIANDSSRVISLPIVAKHNQGKNLLLVMMLLFSTIRDKPFNTNPTISSIFLHFEDSNH